MGKWLIVLPLLFATAVAAAPVWTWVDAEGRRHFSDRPVPGAQEIQVEGAQGFSPSAPGRAEPRARVAQDAAAEPPAAQVYRRFDIVSPAHQETLWNIGAMLPVQVDLEPALQAGHRFDVYLDGSEVLTGLTAPQFTIPDVFRGLHTLQVAIADANGRELLRTQPVTLMVQQTSVLNPNNPNN